jgi:hypothetical protein
VQKRQICLPFCTSNCFFRSGRLNPEGLLDGQTPI